MWSPLNLRILDLKPITFTFAFLHCTPGDPTEHPGDIFKMSIQWVIHLHIDISPLYPWVFNRIPRGIMEKYIIYADLSYF